MSTNGPQPLTEAQLVRVPGVLGKIVRERAAAVQGPRLQVRAGTPGRLRTALDGWAERRRVPAVIAEVKRASPSAGVIADLHPADTAAAYAANGAAAISVLTEERHFGGALTHLEAVSARVSVPTLRKDFVVHPRQLDEAVAAGAAAVLLMVSVLADALPDYLRATELLGLDALVEVHDEAELALALAAGASIIGVNNRDLRTLDIDLMLAPRLIAAGRRQRPDAVWVAESGYREASAVADLVGTADAVLIGSQLAGAASPGGALAELLATARALAERSTQ